jgi:hypothetical protein
MQQYGIINLSLTLELFEIWNGKIQPILLGNYFFFNTIRDLLLFYFFKMYLSIHGPKARFLRCFFRAGIEAENPQGCGGTEHTEDLQRIARPFAFD